MALAGEAQKMTLSDHIFSIVLILITAIVFYGVWFRDWPKKTYKVWTGYLPFFRGWSGGPMIFAIIHKAVIASFLALAIATYVFDLLRYG